MFSNTLAEASPSGDGKLDIVFIGDDYNPVDMWIFRQDATKIKEYLLSVEPFKIRSSQIRFANVENTEDLECNYDTDPGPGSGLYCKWSLARQIVQKAGVRFDKILILVNKFQRGAAGAGFVDGDIGSVQARLSRNATAHHELSHMLGLLDEYNYEKSGNQRNSLNCTLNRPDSSWQSMVPYYNYNKPCGLTNYYSSSSDSVMRSPDIATYYNTVSLNIINKSIDAIAGTMKYSGPFPNARITSPKDGDRVKGFIGIKYSLENTKYLHRVELWIDDEIVIADHNHFQGVFSIVNMPETEKRITIKAFDALGNMGKIHTVVVNGTGKPNPTPVVTITKQPEQTYYPAASISQPTPTITATIAQDQYKGLCSKVKNSDWCGEGFYCDRTSGSNILLYCKNNRQADPNLSKTCSEKCITESYCIQDYCTSGTVTTTPVSPSATPIPYHTVCPTPCTYIENRAETMKKYCDDKLPGQCQAPNHWEYPATCNAAIIEGVCTWSQYGDACTNPNCPCDCVNEKGDPASIAKIISTPTIVIDELKIINYYQALPYCIEADIDNNGIFNIVDYNNLLSTYNKECNPYKTESRCGSVDINGDGVVNYIDFESFTKRYYPYVKNCYI